YDQTLAFSTLSGNKAIGTNAGARGGGAFGAFGTLKVSYSTVDGNYTSGSTGATYCGGLCTRGNLRLVRSTVSGNWTTGSAGGVFKGTDCGNCDFTFYMRDSTVSGNHSGTYYGGVAVQAAHVKLYSSTIAFNTSVIGQVGNVPISPGLNLSAFNY